MVGWHFGWGLDGKNLLESLELSLSGASPQAEFGHSTDELQICSTSVGRGKVHFTQAWLP